MLHVRICAGGRRQRRSLPRSPFRCPFSLPPGAPSAATDQSDLDLGSGRRLRGVYPRKLHGGRRSHGQGRTLEKTSAREVGRRAAVWLGHRG